MTLESDCRGNESPSELNGDQISQLLAFMPKEDGDATSSSLLDGIPVRKGKYGRPKKNPPFSSYRLYDHRDIEFFIHQVSDNEHIYNRKKSLNFDPGFIHSIFDKIETCCMFLSRKNGENASRLWTELASEYKREKARLESLPSGAYTREFEPKFPFLEQMWFLETDNSSLANDVRLNSEDHSNGNSDGANNIPPSNSRKRPAEVSTSAIDRLDDSINRLIGAIEKSQSEAPPTQMVHADLVEHILRFFADIPKERHLEYKCKIVMFLETLKPDSKNV